MTDTHSREAQEIDELLPWYEKGTLDPAEMRRVGTISRRIPRCNSPWTDTRGRFETIAANEGLGMRDRRRASGCLRRLPLKRPPLPPRASVTPVAEFAARKACRRAWVASTAAC